MTSDPNKPDAFQPLHNAPAPGVSADQDMVVLEFPFTLMDRIRAGLAVTFACPLCLLWALAFPAVGLALPVTAYVVSGHVSTSEALLSVVLLAFVPVQLIWGAWRGDKAFKDTALHTYTFSSEGVRSRSAHAEIRQDWSLIRSVRVRSGFLMLFFTRQCAHCIPLRHLSSGKLGQIASLARAAQVPKVAVPGTA